MSKPMKQQQWLNVIIITISALVLAFILLGRFLDPDKNKIKEVTSPTELRMIDFGAQRLTLKAKDRASDQLDSWHGYPEFLLSKEEIKLLVNSWQKVLLMPLEEHGTKSDQSLSGATVLLFFDAYEQPLVARVSIKNIQANNQEIMINFIAEQRSVVIKDASQYRLLPNANELNYQ